MHIVHGELRKAPFIKPGVGQDGQSTMFAVELSEVTKNFQTGEKEYTNYRAVIFAKSPAQIAHYQSTLVEGNYVVVNCEKLKVNVSDCGRYIKLDMDNARLEGSGYITQTKQQSQPVQPGGYQQAAPAQPAYQAPAQQTQIPQGGYQQQPSQQTPKVNPQEPAIDLDNTPF